MSWTGGASFSATTACVAVVGWCCSWRCGGCSLGWVRTLPLHGAVWLRDLSEEAGCADWPSGVLLVCGEGDVGVGGGGESALQRRYPSRL